jgi:alkylation response protein AidB-like acyl-CoA dehydrogenase
MNDTHLIDESEEQKMLIGMLKAWGDQSLKPHAESWDHTEELPASVLQKADELGLHLIALPEEQGGTGMGPKLAMHAAETLAQYQASLALKVALQNGPVSTCWPSELGELDGTWGQGELRVNAQGAHGFITEVAWTRACRWLLIPQGNRLYCIDLHGQGVSIQTHNDRLGIRCAEWADIFLDGAYAQAFPLPKTTYMLAEAWLDLTWSTLALGLGKSALKFALSYIQDRKQFGKTLSKFQAIQWMISDSVTELDAARLLTYEAAHRLELGEVVEGARFAAQARLLAMEAGHQACDRSLQMHGGYGFTQEYQVERLWRDVQRCFPVQGKAKIQKKIMTTLMNA